MIAFIKNGIRLDLKKNVLKKKWIFKYKCDLILNVTLNDLSK